MAVFAIAMAACGGDEGPAAPGGSNGVILTYVTPRLQVVPADTSGRVELALEVRQAVPAGGSEPLAGARLRAVRSKGRGALSSSVVVADDEGIARVQVTMPASTDKTAIVVSLQSDSDSFLPFDVVSAPVVALDLAPGEVVHIDPPRDGAILRVAEEVGARYVLIPYQTDLERGGTAYRFLHQPMNARGAGAAAFGAASVARPYRAATAASPDPGRDLVLGGIEPGPLTPSAAVASTVPIKSCRISADREAPLRYLGRRIAIYVDDDEDMHQARIDSLGAAFDDLVEPSNTQVFGSMSDLDGNGVVLAIFSPAIEGVGGAYCDSVKLQRLEAFYVRWNPDAPIGVAISLMAHEHQHVINAGHHQRIIHEALWLNEALSLAAERISGTWFTVLPRAWKTLNGQNGGLTMLPLEYNRAFDDTYMMFALYLGDRFGRDVYLRVETNRFQSIANVETTTGIPFETLLRDWFVALGVAGRGEVDDPLYTYRSLNLHGMEDEIAACSCVPVARLDGMRLEPMVLGEMFDTFRTLDRADADYYELIAPAETPHREVYYDAYGKQGVKLSVARIQ
ncbi:MAG: hypothetical protein ABR527_05265 [Gemmatimonadota bacterium]